jgi:ATP-dependent 26S proteasome regulatory subunit
MTTNKKKILKWSLLSLLIVITTSGFIGYKMYTKPHRDIENTEAIKVDATKLATEYENNELRANLDYLDKVIDVTGEINEITKNQKGETVFTIKGTDMSGLICTLEEVSPAEIKPGTSVTVKGICTGYLTDVVLVRCKVQSK